MNGSNKSTFNEQMTSPKITHSRERNRTTIS